MRKAKVISIVGARPQFVKLGPLSKEIRKIFQEVIIHTGQHSDIEMSTNFFNDLDIPQPDFNLNISGGSHGVQTAQMMIGLENLLKQLSPDLLIIYGDTNSTVAGSLVCAKLGIKSIHVESGLRSFNRLMPEEINRVVADHLSDYLFVPTETAMNNLVSEGLTQKSYFTGDIMVDSLKMAIQKSLQLGIPQKITLPTGKFYLCTLHRPYNVDDPIKLQKILSLLGELEHTIIFPVHPRTRKMMAENSMKVPNNFILMNPLGYFEFVYLQSTALKIITDSGGVQKEAYMLQKPCITLRTETEWIETVEAGWNLLLNPDTSIDLAHRIDSFVPQKPNQPLFGEGVASKMVTIITEILNN
ncbi:MAG: UDP-N-acetyl glucosamine 2-epimerase [Ignavibacteriaceae bacterium]|nr:MAG: UDP-N-acetyl glucosamine 2-epimerase [Ignavibacteriaceae bacterium]